eukprot:258680_1
MVTKAANARTIGSEVIAKAIVKYWVCRHGPFKQLLSDRGSQFTSQILGEMERCMGFKQRFTTSYHPECNGLLENKHPWIKQKLKLLSEDPSGSWSDAIPMIEYGYNTSRNKMTKYSPHELVYAYKSESAFKKLFKREPSEAAKYQFLRQLVALDTNTRRAHDVHETEWFKRHKEKERRITEALKQQKK